MATREEETGSSGVSDDASFSCDLRFYIVVRFMLVLDGRVYITRASIVFWIRRLFVAKKLELGEPLLAFPHYPIRVIRNQRWKRESRSPLVDIIPRENPKASMLREEPVVGHYLYFR